MSVVLIDYEPNPRRPGPAFRMTAEGRRRLRESRLARGIVDVSGALSVCPEHHELEPCPYCLDADEDIGGTA